MNYAKKNALMLVQMHSDFSYRAYFCMMILLCLQAAWLLMGAKTSFTINEVNFFTDISPTNLIATSC